MRELVLHCPQAHAESVSDALLALGALSISVEDADSQTPLEQPLYGEPGLTPDVQAWQRNRLVALLADGTDPAQLLAQLHEHLREQLRDEQLGDGTDLTTALLEDDWQLREVPDADWVRVTQSQFGPIAIGQNIWVVPSWCQPTHQPEQQRQDTQPPVVSVGAIRIELDPGLAFGTGSHPTTHLCLAWLESHLNQNENKGCTVLDYGCGSGILAIAAKLLGAGATDAVDIDEQAVQAARFNAQRNRVDVQVMLPDVLSTALSARQYQVVVANILSSPLKVLAPMLSNRVAANGLLALSGVLERQAEEVAQAYAPWLQMRVWQCRDGWVCLHGQRRA